MSDTIVDYGRYPFANLSYPLIWIVVGYLMEFTSFNMSFNKTYEPKKKITFLWNRLHDLVLYVLPGKEPIGMTSTVRSTTGYSNWDDVYGAALDILKREAPLLGNIWNIQVGTGPKEVYRAGSYNWSVRILPDFLRALRSWKTPSQGTHLVLQDQHILKLLPKRIKTFEVDLSEIFRTSQVFGCGREKLWYRFLAGMYTHKVNCNRLRIVGCSLFEPEKTIQENIQQAVSQAATEMELHSPKVAETIEGILLSGRLMLFVESEELLPKLNDMHKSALLLLKMGGVQALSEFDKLLVALDNDSNYLGVQDWFNETSLLRNTSSSSSLSSSSSGPQGTQCMDGSQGTTDTKDPQVTQDVQHNETKTPSKYKVIVCLEIPLFGRKVYSMLLDCGERDEQGLNDIKSSVASLVEDVDKKHRNIKDIGYGCFEFHSQNLVMGPLEMLGNPDEIKAGNGIPSRLYTLVPDGLGAELNLLEELCKKYRSNEKGTIINRLTTENSGITEEDLQSLERYVLSTENLCPLVVRYKLPSDLDWQTVKTWEDTKVIIDRLTGRGDTKRLRRADREIERRLVETVIALTTKSSLEVAIYTTNGRTRRDIQLSIVTSLTKRLVGVDIQRVGSRRDDLQITHGDTGIGSTIYFNSISSDRYIRDRKYKPQVLLLLDVDTNIESLLEKMRLVTDPPELITVESQKDYDDIIGLLLNKIPTSVVPLVVKFERCYDLLYQSSSSS